MGIALVRIDDRLIHGQVATTWLNDYEIEQVIIVDDEVEKDEMKKTMATIAGPPNVRVHIFGVEKFIAVQKKNTIKRKTMLLFTNPFSLKKVIDGGIEIDKVYVGGMRAAEGRVRISKAVHVTKKEVEEFKKISDLGISLVVQTVPRDEKQDLMKLLSEYKEG